MAVNVNGIVKIVSDYIVAVYDRQTRSAPDPTAVNRMGVLRQILEYYVHGEYISFIVDAIASNRIIGGSVGPGAKLEFGRGMCYYNSLYYSRVDDDIDLAYGILIDKNSMNRVVSWLGRDSSTRPTPPLLGELTLHSFCIRGSTIIDPTLGRNTSDWYTYMIVPRGTASRFPIRIPDSTYRATEYSEYVRKSISDYSMTRLIERLGL